MASPMSVFDIAGRAMSAQMLRLNTTASNLANASSVSGSEGAAFRSIKPVFRTVTDRPGVATVQVDRVVTASTPPTKRHDPGNPDVCPVYDLHKAFSTPATIERVNVECRRAGIGCVDCKKKMAQNATEYFRQFRERKAALNKKGEKSLLAEMKEASQKASAAAEQTMQKVRKALGIEF